MVRSCGLMLALASGCYEPRVPAGAPCEVDWQCPLPQRCVQDRCSLHDAAPADADEAADGRREIDALIVDAAPDAPPDAVVLPCTADGFTSCGTATVFTCGGHCWVRCRNETTWPNASTACAGWPGALGRIDDAAEQSCVAATLGNDSWIGLVQNDAAMLPGDGWVWNTAGNPVVFMNWQPGKPDDRDGVENRTEQCAMIQTDGRWDDVACAEQHWFYCER